MQNVIIFSETKQAQIQKFDFGILIGFFIKYYAGTPTSVWAFFGHTIFVLESLILLQAGIYVG